MSTSPIPLESLPTELHRFVDPSSPPRMRMMAARSLVPLGPGQLVTVLYLLCYDEDLQVRQAAQESLSQIPDDVLRPALSEPMPAPVLEYLAQALYGTPEYVEPLLLNRHLPDETVVWLAGVVGEQQLEIIGSNQERFLRCPKIIEALYNNPRARHSTVDRAVDFGIRNGLELSGIPVLKEAAAALGYAQPEDEPVRDEVRQGMGATSPDEDESFSKLLGRSSEEEAAEQAAAEAGEERKEQKEEKEKEKDRGNRSNQIANMRPSQKIRLALLGTASDRSVLIRDPTKIVAMAVVKSPKISPQEVEQYAGNPAINADAIRFIAHNREWTKSYAVKLKLVLNPKCPVGNAITFLKFLRRGDLKSVSVNRNVPEAVASTARKMIKSSGQGAKQQS